MLQRRLVLLSCLLVLLSAVGNGDESGELFEAAVTKICGSASVNNVNEACTQKLVTNYFFRFSWCQTSRASCFICDANKLATLGTNLLTFKGSAASVSINDFAKISLALFEIVHHVNEFCNANTVPSKAYSDYWSEVSNEAEFKESKTEWLEHTFKALGSSFNSTQNNNCITNSEIVSESEANSQTTNEKWAQRTTLFSVLHVLNDFILDTTCVSLPTSASILDNLYRVLGLSSRTGRITEAAMKKIYKALQIEPSTTTSTTDSHAGHNHRRKRSVDSHRRYRRAITMVTTNISQCLSVDHMFHVYGVDESLGATSAQFEKLCPALIEQKMSGSCQKKKTESPKATTAQIYGYGTLAVILISCLSLFGVVLVPCMKHSKFDLVMLFFIAMAIGTLITDSLLHLIPESVGLHNHDHGASSGFTPPEPYFWKLFLFVLLLYVLFLFEIGMSYMQYFQSNGISPVRNEANLANGGHTNNHHAGGHHHGHSHFPMEMRTANSEPSIEADGGDVTKSTEDLMPSKVQNSKLTAFIILGGDFVHNFADGLAIGAAFAAGLSSGLSTTVAIAMHELPHEFGDFVVLLSAKISVKRALLLNFLTALSAIVGLYIGISISSNTATREWIFAITGALFLYIALADMMPAMKSTRPSNKLQSFLTQAIGLALGILMIFLLGLFESQIRF